MTIWAEYTMYAFLRNMDEKKKKNETCFVTNIAAAPEGSGVGTKRNRPDKN